MGLSGPLYRLSMISHNYMTPIKIAFIEGDVEIPSLAYRDCDESNLICNVKESYLMTSESIRDPKADHLLTPENCVFIVIDYQPIQVSSIRSMDQKELVFNITHSIKAVKNYNVPIIHSAVNIATGLNKPPIKEIMALLPNDPVIDRTTVNAWEDVEFKQAVQATGRRKLIMTALWTEVCLAFPALDALREGYEVYVVADAIGGTSVAAHELALRRVEQAGGKLISKTQLWCELQRDWARQETVPGFMDVFKNWDGFNPEKDFKG